ncbi:hypothetical protein AAVH_22976 [Aphelenchoides avenae]|nr:hypothetical protein AAVH_22976 [Aphelenchus avenae]
MYVLFRTVRSDNPLGKDYVLCEFDLDDILLRTNGTAALCGDNAEADEDFPSCRPAAPHMQYCFGAQLTNATGREIGRAYVDVGVVLTTERL